MPFIISGYGAARGSASYQVREAVIPFGRSMRLVQLTDIHAGVYMTRADIGRYVDKIISLNPDLFVITGDFISNSVTFLPGCLAELVRVRARYGTYAAAGNHERFLAKPAELTAIFRHYKIPLLVNAHRVIDTESGPFAVAAIDDLRNGHPRLDHALRGIDPEMPVLLLSHRPEIFPRAAARSVRLTLSGHYHGGQIKIGGMSLAHLRTAYPEGLYRMSDAHLYVSRGIGTTFTPIRLNAPPEITVLELK